MSVRGDPRDSGPWCWVEKSVLRLIRDKFEPRSRVHAVATVAALAELASDKGANVFEEKTAVIAHRAGFSYRKCFAILKSLEEVGIISIRKQRLTNSNLDSPSEYSLLSLCTPCIGLCTDVEHTIRADRYEERSQKNQRRKNKERPPTPRGASCRGTASLRRLFIEMGGKDEELAQAIMDFCGHYIENRTITEEDLLTYLACCGNDRMVEYGFAAEVFEFYERPEENIEDCWTEMYCLASNAFVEGEITAQMCRDYPHDIKDFMIEHLEGDLRDHLKTVAIQADALARVDRESRVESAA